MVSDISELAGRPTFSIYGHPLYLYSLTQPTLHFLFKCKRKPGKLAGREKILSTELQPIAFQRAESESYPSVVLRGYTGTFRAQSSLEKRNQGDMKFLSENIKVFYYASDCVEPYVEVGLCWIDRDIEIDRSGTAGLFLHSPTNFVILPSPDYHS